MQELSGCLIGRAWKRQNWGPDGQRRDSGKDPGQKCVSRGNVGEQGINSSSL